MSKASLRRKLEFCILVFALFTSAAYAQFSVLYSYGSKAGDPADPINTTRIAQGRDGNLYTTGSVGGSTGNGAAFKITPSGTLTVLYSFCSLAGCADGQSPRGGLTLGTDGNFYGTTNLGGNSADAGIIFQMTPSGTLKVLHTFTNGADGGASWAPPVEGLDGNFYGTTNTGGGGGGCGTIYKITPAGAFSVLHTFGSAGVDACSPRSPLVLGSDGNFYGTGSYGAYATFKITPAGKYTPLTPSSKLVGMFGPLIQGTNGSFYGASGNNIFKMSASGGVTILHTLNNTTEGSGPYDGVVQASDGSFYGTTQSGGTNTNCPSNLGTCGVLFKITPTGADTTLFDFEDPDGYEPTALIPHTNGIIYGQANFGGTTPANAGTFWSWNAGLKPFVSFMPFTGHVGDQIQIFGQGFTNSSVVKFNGVVANYTLTGSTFITATVPPGTLDGYITVTTGSATLKSLYKFMVHDSWGSGAAIPLAVRYPATGVINGKIYVVGGNTVGGSTGAVNNNQIYNTATNKWSTGAVIPVNTYAAASAVVNNILYVFGGTTTGSDITKAVWAYNPSTNSWTSKAPMPTARQAASAAVEKGIIYVIGGNDTGNGRFANNEAYNPATNTWTTEAPMLVTKSDLVAGLVGSTIVAADGFNGTTDNGDTEGYNAGTNLWRSLTADPMGRNGVCGGVINGQLYVAGGYPGGSPGTPALKLNESYSLTGNKWTTLAPMPQAALTAGSAVNGGMLYCLGGETALQGTVFNNVQIYQP